MTDASSFKVRLATPHDREPLARIFHEIDLHYYGEAAPDPAAMRTHVLDTVLGPGSGCEIAVAVKDAQVMGLAIFAVLYPAPNLSGSLYMKDLFTVSEARGQGVGQAIMGYLARLAVARGYSRLDWTAEKRNWAALGFYDSLRATRVHEKVYFRVDGEALRDLAGAQSDKEAAP